jgi:pimeloyl-ACP methyl ester carboxylesterase
MAMGGRTSAALALALAAAAPAATAAAHQAVAGEIDRSLVPYADPKDAVVLPDGRRVHMVRMGRGSPTVVFTAGAGDWSLTWSKVQPAVAKATRACAWDRAGFGLSAPPASPQTVDQTTGDLQAALRAGRVAGPYVLVGHSLGGYESLLFADREPGSVAGMVLVDPAFPDQLTPLSKAAPAQARYMLSLPNPLTELFRKCSAGFKAGTLRRDGPDPDGCFHPQWPASYPPELTAALDKRVAGATREQLLAVWDTMLFFGSPQLLDRDSKVVVNPKRNYGAMPLIVLTRTEFQPPLDYPEAARAEIPAEEAAWNQGHDQLAALSTRGVNARVPGAPHFIHDAKPRVVIDAIEQVVREARESGGTKNAR